MHVLAITAHPDDAEIYLGGSLLAWRDRGARTSVLIATDGRLGGKADPAILASARAAEARKGADMLDAELYMLGFPDGSLSGNPQGLIEGTSKVISDLAPNLVVTHAVNDYHADHRALAGAVLQASGFHVPVAHFDTLSGLGSEPRYWIDVSEFASKKADAILCHRTQDPPRLVRLAETLSRQRAAQCGNPDGHAEALSFSPRYPFADIRSLLPDAPSIRPVIDRSRS